MVDQATVEKVLDAANIVDVISQFVTLRKRGVNYVGLCPFHNEKTPSFYVSPSKSICKCFSCGKGGNVIHFVMEHEQLSFQKAVEWLAEKYGIPYSRREMTPEEKLRQDERESMLILNEFACKWFQTALNETEMGKAIGKAYFRKRGFRDDIIEKFRLGYSPESGISIAQQALDKGFRREFLISTGLCYERDDKSLRDRFHGRAIFPIFSVSGKVIGFGGRIMTSDAKAAKYVNSPESCVYVKNRELYGLYQARQAIVRQDRCFLVEGYADVISMHQAGVENVVASSGTSLTTGQIRLIHRFTNNITVLYDGDKAGIKASIRGIDMLLEEGMNVKVLLLPDGEDPDSFARGRSATEFQEYIANHQVDFIRFKIQLLMDEAAGDPIRRAGLIKEINTSISVIPDQVIRSVYIRECSQLLQSDERLLISEINALQRNRTAEKAGQEQQSQVRDSGESEQNVGEMEEKSEPADIDPVESLRREIRALIHSDKADIISKEHLLARMLVRFGERVCCYTQYQGMDDYPMTVGELIIGSLRNDGLSFLHPVYRKMASLFEENHNNSGFRSERFFISHPDSTISLTAASLIEDRYQLSNFYKNMPRLNEDDDLYGTASHIITDYQLAVVSCRIAEIKHKLKDCNQSDVTDLMKEYQALLSARNSLAHKLGDRIVT